jgi:hypothetical protein
MQSEEYRKVQRSPSPVSTSWSGSAITVTIPIPFGGSQQLIDAPARMGLQALSERVDTIEGRVATLEAGMVSQPEVVLVEELSREEAKKRIESYFETHDEADTEELMRALRIDLELLVNLLDELKREGKIRSVDGP